MALGQITGQGQTSQPGQGQMSEIGQYPGPGMQSQSGQLQGQGLGMFGQPRPPYGQLSGPGM
ncbi:hypothetical protein ACFYW6_38215 [Streptomyces sp. NPDC002659]|uniref:hypothetical protein n=1 Tax=Streptomyces sp. NPDC002659 TaxID=3364656 RepID=UPI0036C2A74C